MESGFCTFSALGDRSVLFRFFCCDLMPKPNDKQFFFVGKEPISNCYSFEGRETNNEN